MGQGVRDYFLIQMSNGKKLTGLYEGLRSKFLIVALTGLRVVRENKLESLSYEFGFVKISVPFPNILP